MKDDRRDFFDKELVTKFNVEKFLVEKADVAIDQDRLEDAASFLNSTLLVNPDNKEALQKIDEIKVVRVRSLAHAFIKCFYPSELNLFDLTWRVFKDFQAKDLQNLTVAGALGITGKGELHLNAPRVIIVLNQLLRYNYHRSSEEQMRGEIRKVSILAGCHNDLIKQIIKFLLEDQ